MAITSAFQQPKEANNKIMKQGKYILVVLALVLGPLAWAAKPIHNVID